MNYPKTFSEALEHMAKTQAERLRSEIQGYICEVDALLLAVPAAARELVPIRARLVELERNPSGTSMDVALLLMRAVSAVAEADHLKAEISH